MTFPGTIPLRSPIRPGTTGPDTIRPDTIRPETTGRTRTAHHGGILAPAFLAAVTVAVALVLAWDLSGGQLRVMETPSMCPSVCVGSLIGGRPLAGPHHLAELVTFHPPGSTTETYTHEISRILPGGRIQTRGVGNTDHDPWLITRSDIVDGVTFTVWGLGWLFEALPLLAVGALAWAVTTPMIAIRTRRAWDRIWVTALVALPLWLLHPLVEATVISTTADPERHRWMRMTVVNTGLLPSAFHADRGGVTAHVDPTLLAHTSGPPDGHGAIVVTQTVSLHWWGWVTVGCVVASPLLGYLWHMWQDDEAPRLPVPEPR
jgi:hypothetical protein